MKQEFEMTQQNMDDIIAINKNMSPVMKFGDSWSGLDLTGKINAYWEKLGDKMGFKHLTVEGSSRGKLFFLAEPKPIVVPKTAAQLEIEKYTSDAQGYTSNQTKTSLLKIVEQLEGCNYENEAGLLNMNVAFIALKQLAN